MTGIVIAGPTGVGKTNISLKIAQRLSGEIISADSMQVYKYMDIGTAKIKEEEKQGIVHHMIDIILPNELFNVGKYYEQTGEILNELEKTNKAVLVVGGTGLYINSITEGLSILPDQDKKLRAKLKNLDINFLNEKLLELDKESYNNIDKNNKKRIVRAIEVCELTGEKFSELKTKNKKNNNYNFIKIGLIRNRENLYDRINKRVDRMFENGLEKEADFLYKNYGKEVTSMQAIGYKELFLYFNKEISLDEAKENIKKATRNYAKRQISWFKRNKDMIWFNLDNKKEEEVIDSILKIL